MALSLMNGMFGNDATPLVLVRTGTPPRVTLLRRVTLG